MEKKPLKIKWSRNESIRCSDSSCSMFGGEYGHDLVIAKKSNTNTISWSNLGNSYVHPNYAFESNEALSFLVGSYYFQASEIEVYTK